MPLSSNSFYIIHTNKPQTILIQQFQLLTIMLTNKPHSNKLIKTLEKKLLAFHKNTKFNLHFLLKKKHRIKD